jgi:hypothetical protein
MLSGLNIPQIRLSALRDLKLQNFSLAEDQPYGYMVNVNLEDGTASIYQNWKQWPQVGAECRDEKCWETLRLKESEMPKNAEAIDAANAFIQRMGIPTAGYGTPAVNEQWRNDLARTEDKSMFYFPDMVTVTYPYLVDGKAVLDEGGNPNGLQVTYDIRSKKVSGAYPILLAPLEQETMQGETDVQRILKLAENGGYYYMPEPPMPFEGMPEATITTLKLGTPTLTYVTSWMNEMQKGGYEIIVPALVFPVLDNKDAYGRKNVTIPLAKPILDASQSPITYK